MAHPRKLVARIKGALMAGLEPKQISKHTGISSDTIKQWSRGNLRADVEADPTVPQDIKQAILRDFLKAS